ncbi:odontogenic ameloblast-associated protein isoform X1 [Ambystoma mexicanum]|uniref:odontogenic ameloblast-associated protein isoform X1 n=1 Tax=Ambystoma mexicanum TaxID=8296 RepID=UPI0037E8D101
MKAVALLFCLIGTACSLPLIPRRIFSASASNELLLALGLSNAGLLPPQLQGGAVGRLFPGILQQPQIPGLAQVAFGPRGPFVGQLPNQIAFPGQVPLPQPGQGAQQTQQAQQQDPANPQGPQQNQQPNQVMPYMVSYGFPQGQGQGQGQGQMMQYYPLYMYPQQQQPPQQPPQQPGQQQPTDQNTPFINQQRGFVPQQAAPVVPGAQQQQQMPSNPSAAGALTTQTVPFGGIIPQFHGDRMNFANGGLMLPTTTIAPSAKALASSPDPTVDANNQKDKANFNLFMEP